MPTKWGVEIQGLKQVRNKADKMARITHTPQVFSAFRDGTMIVMAEAGRRAPVDRGQLRASILPEVKTTGDQIQGIVYSNAKHAPFMEFGTKPHWPPLHALELWARRHHTTAFVVARAIAKKGIKARRFMRDGLTFTSKRVITRIRRGVQEALHS